MNKKYFEWLYSLIEESNPGGLSYRYLMVDLHHDDFIGLIPNDDNRARDGEDLRVRFMDDYETDIFPLKGRPCTVLEMLIALAYRMEEIMIGESFAMSMSQCFWLFLKNLDLDWFDDSRYHSNGEEIEEKIRKFLERKYNHNGNGGIFPLNKAKKDQRDVEIWYQMSAYLLEKYKF